MPTWGSELPVPLVTVCVRLTHCHSTVDPTRIFAVSTGVPLLPSESNTNPDAVNVTAGVAVEPAPLGGWAA